MALELALVDQELVDPGRLGEWMQAQGLPEGPFENERLLTGGTQNTLLYFERGGQPFILRRPPRHLRANSNKVMMREALMLRALTGSGVPHPGYIAHCEDESVLGAAFFLMEPVEGFNPTVGMLPEPHRSDASLRRRMGESHMEALARLGSLDYKTLGLENFGKPEGFLQRQPDRWRGELQNFSQLDGYGDSDLPHEEEIYQWLVGRTPVDFQPGIIHGDCHLANTMVNLNNGELAALIDWEMSTIGDPLLDLGWVMATSPNDDGFAISVVDPADGCLSIAEMVSHYGRHSSRDLSSLQWYAVMACYKLGVILEGTHARACAGKADKAMGEQMHELTLMLFNRARRWIEQGIPNQA